MKSARWLALAAALVTVMSFCGGDPASTPAPPAAAPVAVAPVAPSPAAPPPPDPACVCTPTDPPSGDYRHDAKHVDMIVASPQEVTVADVIAWAHTAPKSDAPRAGRELQLFHIATAYLQTVYICKDDCDLHMELSATPDPTAPRIIVETPIDSSYCPARMKLDAALKAKGFSMTWGTVPSLPVEVTGMAFEDYEHVRGSNLVAGPWELHPAVVTLLP